MSNPAALGLGLANPANATLQVAVTVYDVLNPAIFSSTVAVDGGAGDTDGLLNNQVLLGNNFQPIPGYVVQGSFHTSFSPALALLTSGSSSVTNNTGSTVRAYVAVGDTDFAPAKYSWQTTGSGTFVNAIGSTMYNAFYDDPANAQGADVAFADVADFVLNSPNLTPGNLIDTFSFAPITPLDSYSFDQTGLLAVPDLADFGMTMLFDFTLVNGGQLTSRGQSLLKIPEPASMLLLGVGLLGLAATRRRQLV